MLKKIFTEVTNDQFYIRGDQFFSRNDSMEFFLTSDFDYLFDVGDIHFSLRPLPSYSISNVETLDNYFKEWMIQYGKLKLIKWKAEENMLKMIYDLRRPFLSLLVALTINYEQKNNGMSPTPKILRGLVAEKMMTILCISERKERRYWNGMWRLIELLHVTRCSVNILVKARINSIFLMRTSINDYDKFLKILSDDERVFHRTPLFDKLLIQKTKEVVHKWEINTID